MQLPCVVQKVQFSFMRLSILNFDAIVVGTMPQQDAYGSV